MKKITASFLALVLVLGAAGCGAPQTSSAPSDAQKSSSIAVDNNSSTTDTPGSSTVSIPNQQLSFGSASSGGAYYVIGTGFSEVVSSHIPEINMTCEITDGGVANVRLVNDGDCDVAISNSDSVQYALSGTGPYSGVQDIQVIGALHSSVWHCVTTQNSGVTSIADLKGKKVAIGPAGGGSVVGMEAALAAYGMTIDDIIPTYVSYDDGITQLKDGQVVAALAMAGAPAPAISSMAATDKVVMINIDDEHMAKIIESSPYYSAVTVAADVYGMDNAAQTIGVKNIVYGSNNLSDDTIYAITKAVAENLDELKTYHSAVKDVSPESMADVGTYPLAAGAERYYKEAGIIK